MISGKITIKNNISPLLKKQVKEIQQLPQEAYKVFVQETPIQRGNARRNTKLKNKTIEANYPYAKRLNEGYSKQSPAGMVKPTEEFIAKQFVKIITGK